MPELINLTPHPITIWRDDAPWLTIPVSGPMARLVELPEDNGSLTWKGNDIPLRRVVYNGNVENLPAPRPDVYYLVSRPLAAAVNRADLLFPDGEVRDGQGSVVGCRGLGRMIAAAG